MKIGQRVLYKEIVHTILHIYQSGYVEIKRVDDCSVFEIEKKPLVELVYCSELKLLEEEKTASHP